jgi:hypothetical protein
LSCSSGRGAHLWVVDRDAPVLGHALAALHPTAAGIGLEMKFLQVKKIIERFRGREGSTDLDDRRTRKVTDVRNWFVFSASERFIEGDAEHEHYADSGGKMGGTHPGPYTGPHGSRNVQSRKEARQDREGYASAPAGSPGAGQAGE